MVSLFETAHDRIRVAVAAGRVASFATSADPPAVADYEDRFWADRTIDAAWLADFLCALAPNGHRHGVHIQGVRIEGPLDLDGATIHSRLAITASNFGPHPIQLAEAHLNSLDLSHTRCGGINANNCQVVSNVILGNGFTAAGEVRAVGVRIGGSLICSGGLFTNLNDSALVCDLARVGGGVFLRDGFTANGAVGLSSASIDGDLHCTGGLFNNSGGNALVCETTQVRSNVFLSNGFVANGVVHLTGTTIEGGLICNGGVFNNLGGDAFVYSHAHVSGGVFLGERFTANGVVRLSSSTIGSALDCSGGVFSNPNGDALVCDGAEINGVVGLRRGFKAEGIVSLSGVTCGGLADDASSWPRRCRLDGFRYRQLHSPDLGWKQRKDWLQRQTTPSPDAYTHLASIYRAAGRDRDARMVLIERHNVLIHPPAHWEADLPSGLRGIAFRGRTWFLRVTVGHGYEPGRILGFILPLLALMTIWYSYAADNDMLRATRSSTTGAVPTSSDCASSYACVQPFFYALDTLVPLVDLGQRSEWAPDASQTSANWWNSGRALANATWVTTLLGWATAVLITASFTQAIKRE